ncbi:MAG: trp operon repressor [Candidatus Pacebacteria bacterium]|nr:trp operon repressor [Candidatus Paceibacterota bacterium]
MKKRSNDLSDFERMQTLDMLYTATSGVRGRDSMRRFLRDLLTESERIMLGRRIWIARLLLQDWTYDEIAIELKVGYGTISRVDRWLRDQMPGYEEAIQALYEEDAKREKGRAVAMNPFGLTALKKKYPLHFLLFPDPVKVKKVKNSRRRGKRKD